MSKLGDIGRGITYRLENLSQKFHNKGKDDSAEVVDRVNRRIARLTTIDNDELTAYHEAGHSLLQYLLHPHSQPRKATIINSNYALGYAAVKSEVAETGLMSELFNDMCINYGGYAAEKLIYGETSRGCSGDLEDIRSSARNMVRQYHMSNVTPVQTLPQIAHSKVSFLGLVVWEKSTPIETQPSPELVRKMEKAEIRIMERAEKTASFLLRAYEPSLRALAKNLTIQRTLLGDEIAAIIEEAQGYEAPAETLRL